MRYTHPEVVVSAPDQDPVNPLVDTVDVELGEHHDVLCVAGLKTTNSSNPPIIMTP